MKRLGLLKSICITVCILTLLCFIALYTRQRQISFFSESLRKSSIATRVEVNGHSLEVEAGVVSLNDSSVDDGLKLEALRLAYAKTIAERSPLFALPGTSPSDLNYAIDKLQQVSARLADIQKDKALAGLVRTSLYPLDFLRKAALAENARQQFIQHPDTEHERQYDEAIRNEVISYLSDLRKFRTGVSRAIPDSSPKYVAAGKLVSKEGIVAALDILQTGIQTSAQTLKARELCLRGLIFRCDPRDLKLPVLPTQQLDKLSIASIDNAEQIRLWYAHSISEAKTNTLLSPLIVLSHTACLEQLPGARIFTIASIRPKPGVPSYFRAIYVGDIRMLSLSAYAKLPFYQDLLSRGIEYVLSPPLLHYECMDQGRDSSAIEFTQEVMQAASSSAPVFYESEAINRVGHLAQSADPKGIELSLSYTDSSSHFEQILRGIAQVESVNMGIIKDGIAADLDASNLFFSRSGFVSLFAADNPSFVGTVSLFPEASSTRDKDPYVYLSSITDNQQREKILNNIQAYISLHLNTLNDVP